MIARKATIAFICENSTPHEQKHRTCKLKYPNPIYASQDCPKICIHGRPIVGMHPGTSANALIVNTLIISLFMSAAPGYSPTN